MGANRNHNDNVKKTTSDSVHGKYDFCNDDSSIVLILLIL